MIQVTEWTACKMDVVFFPPKQEISFWWVMESKCCATCFKCNGKGHMSQMCPLRMLPASYLREVRRSLPAGTPLLSVNQSKPTSETTQSPSETPSEAPSETPSEATKAPSESSIRSHKSPFREFEWSVYCSNWRFSRSPMNKKKVSFVVGLFLIRDQFSQSRH